MRRVTTVLAALAVVAVSLPVSAAAAPSVLPAAVATCRTAQLSVAAGESDGAAGTIYNTYVFTNRSSRTCVMRGYPNLTRYDTGGRAMVTRERRDIAPGRTTVTLAPGGTASFVWAYTDVPQGDATSCRKARVLAVRPPGRSAALYVPVQDIPVCAAYVRVSAVAPGVTPVP